MSLLSALFGGGGDKDAQAALDQYNGITTPDTDAEQLQLQQYVDQGILTPEQAKAYTVNGSALSDMDLDTQGKAAQLSALQSLQNIGNNGGLTDSDKSALQQIQSKEQSTAKGARDAILQNAQARGAGGSGLSMLAQLQNAQDSATRQSASDLSVAGQAQDRALQALQSAGTLGGTINQNQFNQQATIANSQNAINQFNAANQQQVGLANTSANNSAQASNLANKQTVANANTQLANQQQQYNKSLAQTDYNNQLQLANSKAGAYGTAANQANQDRSGNMGLVGSLASAGATAISDERAKEEIKPFDASSFLDSLTGYKYKYKDPSDGAGKQVGVMAQDLEKEVPQMVKEAPSGKKMVDYSPAKAGGPILAGLADLHERLKHLEGKKS